MSQWISVKDRYPENEVQVLIWDEYQQQTAVWWKDIERFYNGSHFVPFVTHWMSLPEPPK